MQMISSAVCALRTLAFTLDAARLAAAIKAAGSGRRWPPSWATRPVTSYLLGRFVHARHCKRKVQHDMGHFRR
jgi:hypothetical protein